MGDKALAGLSGQPDLKVEDRKPRGARRRVCGLETGSAFPKRAAAFSAGRGSRALSAHAGGEDRIPVKMMARVPGAGAPGLHAWLAGGGAARTAGPPRGRRDGRAAGIRPRARPPPRACDAAAFRPPYALQGAGADVGAGDTLPYAQCREEGRDPGPKRQALTRRAATSRAPRPPAGSRAASRACVPAGAGSALPTPSTRAPAWRSAGRLPTA